MHRQAAYVAASRASQDTHFYALAIADPDELSCPSRPGLSPPPDPDDARALAEAMTRDASQVLASDIDPLAAALGELMARPTAWLAAEREDVAERLGGRATLAEALRLVRARLAEVYRLPLESLECRPLTQAMTSALQVPGATPERLVELMLSRDHEGVRELASAADPLAVLVWAAGDHAQAILAAEAEARDRTDDRSPSERRCEAELGARLVLLDQALARQRDARLALIECEPQSPVARLLGPPPGRPGGLVAWRRAARAIVEFRDEAGLFDRTIEAEDPVVAALGAEPVDAVLAEHRRAACGVIDEARAAMVLAELVAHVPALGERPRPAVAALAERPLGVLEAELDTLRYRPRVVGRRAGAGVGQPDRDALVRARDLADAIAVRQRRLAGAVLVDSPRWVLADVTRRVRRGETPEPSALAHAYGQIATELDGDEATNERAVFERVNAVLVTRADLDGRRSDPTRGQPHGRTMDLGR